MELNGYIACLCEGSAEEAVIDILLDANLLIFNRGQMLDERPLRVRKAENFERQYLRKGFKSTITVVRIIDSRNEKFKLSKAYAGKVSVINVITAPEIEMLIILNEGKYVSYKNSHKKPSDFCKTELKMHREVKSYDFIRNYFNDPVQLVNAIRNYDHVTAKPKGEYSLSDLLNLSSR